MNRLDMKSRKAVLQSMAKGYKGLRKRDKGSRIGEVMGLLGYRRSYAAWVLRRYAEEATERPLGVVRPFKRRRKVFYGAPVREVLKRLWVLEDYICGKRLAPIIPALIAKLVQCGELKTPPGVLRKLSRMSPATMDRILAPEKATNGMKSRARTKPGSLLKSQIPIRTFADWDEHRPGFIEIDLVGHDGGNASGDFAQTLDVTDVASGWTETQAVPNKAQIHVLNALKEIHSRLPFPLYGVDSDNGSEFINEHLTRYCREEHLTFTRSRPYRKNDTCFVEQKNWSVVRRTVGYNRYDTPEALTLLNTLYRSLRLYTNFFQPCMKLIDKVRDGAHVTRHHDKAKTPMTRLLESPDVEERFKRRLRRLYDQLNPVTLKRKIDELQLQLEKLTRRDRQKPSHAAL